MGGFERVVAIIETEAAFVRRELAELEAPPAEPENRKRAMALRTYRGLGAEFEAAIALLKGTERERA